MNDKDKKDIRELCNQGFSIAQISKKLNLIYSSTAGVILREKIPHKNGQKGLREHASWKGYGEISGRLFYSIKRHAIERNLLFLISLEQIWDLFLKQNRKCALSGIDLKFSSSARSSDGTASLDRIDSLKGYTVDNVQWVHKELNEMKMNMQESKFFQWIELVHKNQLNKSNMR